MFTVRGAREKDVQALVALAETAGTAFTSLPPDEAFVAGRVDAARRGDAPLLVMDDPAGRLVGVSGIVRHVGQDEPWYCYRLETREVRSHALDTTREIATLHLETRHHGPSEVGSLLLHPEARGQAAGLGRLLSGSRYLLMRRDPAGFAHTTLAELRPPCRPDGGNAFWDAIGARYFGEFGLDYTAADRLSATDKRFIAELMPRQPIDVCLLPPEAREIIGQVMEDTLPAKRMLEAEGFAFADAVDIFDAGPVFSCLTAEIATIRHAADAVAAEGGPPADTEPTHLVARSRGPFRCVLAAASIDEDRVQLSPEALVALDVSEGEPVLASPRRPQPK